MSKKRLFVAIGLPDPVITELEKLQKQLKPFAREAKWVRTAGIHLTLKFLGYVESGNVPAIETVLSDVAKRNGTISIRANGCGFFPNPRRPNVLWAGIESSDLLPLQEQIEDSMTKLGFEKENRAYSPHLTLARFKDQRGLLPLAQEVEKFSGIRFGEFTAQSFSLYESILRPQGAEYHKLQDFFLTEASKDNKEKE